MQFLQLQLSLYTVLTLILSLINFSALHLLASEIIVKKNLLIWKVTLNAYLMINSIEIIKIMFAHCSFS
jgi:hypothetical protein